MVFTLFGQTIDYDAITHLNVESIDRAVVFPRLTTAQMNNIPALNEDGLFIYNISEGKHYEYSFIAGWQPVSPLVPNDGFWQMPVGQRLGIARFPDFPLDVAGSARILGNLILGEDSSAILGSIRYNAIMSDFEGFTSSGWTTLTGSSKWNNNASGIDYSGGSVGIGVSIPSAELHVQSPDPLANILLTSPGGAGIRTFAFNNSSAGIITTTNIPLTIGANNFSALAANSDRSVDFFGDLTIPSENSISLGNFNSIRTNSSDQLLISGDIAGINMSTCGGPITIEADCESSLLLRGWFDATLSGHFGTFVESTGGPIVMDADGGPIQFEIANTIAGVISNNQNWGIKTSSPVSDLHIDQDETSNFGGLLLQNDGAGDDYWNFRIGVNDLDLYYDADGPGTSNSLIRIARVDDADGSWDMLSDRRLKKSISSLETVLTRDIQK